MALVLDREIVTKRVSKEVLDTRLGVWYTRRYGERPLSDNWSK